MDLLFTDEADNQEQIDYIYMLVPSDEVGLSIERHDGCGSPNLICGFELVATEGNGYDLLAEDISNIGVEAIEKLIIPDEGLAVGKKYKIKAVNLSRDWETGVVDDYDLELYEVKDV